MVWCFQEFNISRSSRHCNLQTFRAPVSGGIMFSGNIMKILSMEMNNFLKAYIDDSNDLQMALVYVNL